MRRRTINGLFAALASAAVVVTGLVPAQAQTPGAAPDTDNLPRMSSPSAEEFRAAAAHLPAELSDAIQRDLGIDAATYLAEGQAAVDAAELVDALEDAGVDVTGSEIDGVELTVYVADEEDAATVRAVGVTAVVGAPEAPDLEGVDFEAADDLYGGGGWGMQMDGNPSTGSGGYVTCSLGFSGYNTSGDDVMLSAGHCVDEYAGRVADPRSLRWDQPRQYGGVFALGDPIGPLVSGSAHYGGGYDVALLSTTGSTAIARPQVVRWGSTGTGNGQGAPTATTPLAVTGQTAGVAGASVCKSGARTGWTCGQIQSLDQTVTVSGRNVNVMVTSTCVLSGDSGGVLLVGSFAAGITSGSSFPEGHADPCSVSERQSVFFPMVSPGGKQSVAQRYGSSWTLCTGPVPFVTSASPGGAAGQAAPLAGKLPCAVAGATTTVSLYLNGSTTPYATVIPSGTAGTWSFNLNSLPEGNYSYAIRASWGGQQSPTRSGAFLIGSKPNVNVLPGRLEGTDRYATAAAIAQAWDGYFDAHTVFVATGENYPDALSAAAAAAHLGAPVLLTKKNELPAVVKSRLNALKPKRIVVLGSTAAVANSVVNALKTVSGSPTVERWYGADRYATMREIVKRSWGVNGNGDRAEGVRLHTVVIATGKNFPDALSAAPAVAAVHGAVLLVDGSAGSIPAATLNLIRDLNPQRIVIAGSTAAVKKGIETQLRSQFGSGTVTRLAGTDRFHTSALVTRHFYSDADAVFFATGRNFPDALSGAALAGSLQAPLVVAERSCVTGAVRQAVNAVTPSKRVLLGSSKALLSSVANLALC